MTLQEAISQVNKRSCNANLQWFICKWNNGYIIHSTSYMKRFPDTKFVYSTGPLERQWDVVYNSKERRFKHVIR